MNRLFKIILFITLAGGLFFSCSNEDNSQSQVMILALNNSNANASKTMAETQVSGKAYVSVSLDAKSRTIMPDLPDFVNDDSFSFTLSQKTSSFGERTIKTWETTETQSAYTQMTTEKEIVVDYAENGCTFELTVFNENYTYSSTVDVDKVSSGEKIALSFTKFYIVNCSNKGNLKVKLFFPSDAGVKTVTAELYYVNRYGYETKSSLEELEIITDDSESYVIYDKDNFEEKNVYVQFYLYDQAGNFLNSFRESVILHGDCYAERHIQDVNKIHQIIFDTEFNCNEVTYDGNVYFSEYERVTLGEPTCPYYTFEGWYDNPDFTGDAITGWNFGEKTENVLLYPKFAVKDVYYAIKTLNKPGTYKVIIDNNTKWENVTKEFNENFSNESNDIYIDLVLKKGVTSIGDYYFYKWPLISVELPEDLENIGASAFCRCTGLTSIEIPEGVTSIGRCVFYGCTGLTNMEIPNSVTSIGDSVFENCTALTSIKLPEGLTRIEECTFENCSSLVSLVIPESVISIGDSVFKNCTALTSIKLPEGLTRIEECTFENCSSLVSLVIPESVISIGDSVFKNCTDLTSIELPKGLTNIGDFAFSNCSMVSLVIPESVTYLGYGALTKKLKKITIPGHIEYGDGEAYGRKEVYGTLATYNFEELELIITGNEIKANYKGKHFINDIEKEYSGGLCEGLVGLRSVIISDSVTRIGRNAFSGCTGLTSIELPEGITNIGSNAFSGCTGLTSFVIPESVIYLGYNALDGCKNLRKLTIPGHIEYEITYKYFNYSKNGAYYGYVCSTLGGCNSSDLELIITGNIIKSTEGVRSGSIYYYCDGDLQNWHGGLFEGLSGLKKIIIPDSVTSIGDFAFCDCTGLTSIEIPESVTSIGEGAFCDCTNLTSVILKDPTGWSYLSDDAEENARFLRTYGNPHTKTGGSN